MVGLVHELLGDIDRVVDAQWRTLGEPGTWLDGTRRRAVAAATRSGSPGGTGAPASLDDVARLVAFRAYTISAATVDAIEASGIDRETYVEVVGIVSRVVAIDTFDRGIGRPARPLPPAVDGAPSRERAIGARRRAGWAPTVGAIGPESALSAVPPEAADQAALHAVWYLPYDEMVDLDVDRGLHRTQMELVAARVSLLNDCHF